ncbi:uncharacterized protein N7459_008527 [Penicillium hispanicum]|uniref:uncharacterized protein n=1 Tax=Penicillium hispanicum TaxID=1080232 RepID=UPI00253FE138|nr:uncharacterized protein N7459_008527 [Penicillium hispanicum]KAJ5574100.1 hypothetical protein N7459_008527 [Penicillium hispanicum]
MSVFAFVQRALPFPLSWKRRPSTSSKGKEKEKEPSPACSEHDASEFELGFGNDFAGTPSTFLHRDVSHVLHVAVKQGPDSTSPDSAPNKSSETDPDSILEYQTRQSADDDESSLRSSQLARAVSWASIVRSRCRWTRVQERELAMAERQLARCQKAWSSEQELWLAYMRLVSSFLLTMPSKIEALSEEKKAHEGFKLMRMRQQEEERSQFRKAWKRRRSVENVENPVRHKQNDSMKRKTADGLSKLRRLQRYGSMAPSLAVTESKVLTCR